MPAFLEDLILTFTFELQTAIQKIAAHKAEETYDGSRLLENFIQVAKNQAESYCASFIKPALFARRFVLVRVLIKASKLTCSSCTRKNDHAYPGSQKPVMSPPQIFVFIGDYRRKLLERADQPLTNGRGIASQNSGCHQCCAHVRYVLECQLT